MRFLTKLGNDARVQGQGVKRKRNLARGNDEDPVGVGWNHEDQERKQQTETERMGN